MPIQVGRMEIPASATAPQVQGAIKRVHDAMTGQLPELPTASRRKRRQAGRFFRRFGPAQSGATAVEFGFIAFPFFMLLAAILEMAMMFWTNQVLEEALSETARSLLTGQSRTLYTGANAASTFRDKVCANAPGLVDCSKLAIDVRAYTSFADAQAGTAATNPISGGGLNTQKFGYVQPSAEQIVVVRAALEYHLYFTQWSNALANIGTGKRGLVASTTFRAEPFT